MDKEDVVHMYNGILLSHEKEQIWISSSEVDEPRACFTEWSKSEIEKQISYINTHIYRIWENGTVNLFAGQTQRHRHREQNLDTAGEGEDGMNRENSTDTYTLPYVR